MKKVVKWILAVLLLLLMGLYWVYEMKKPLEAEFLEVKAREVTLSFREKGTVEAVVKRDIYSASTQKILEIPVEEGQMVEEGMILAKLDAEPIRKQIAVLEAQRNNLLQLKNMTMKELYSQIEQQEMLVQETTRQLETARREFERIQKLHEQHSASTADVEAIENRISLLEGTIEQQELGLRQLLQQYENPESETVRYHNSGIQTIDAQLQQLKSQLKDCVITAPINGILINLNGKEGGVLQPNIPLCTLYDPKSYHIVVMVLAEEAINLEKGMKVKLTQKQTRGDRHFEGEIGYMAPVAVESLSTLGLKEQRVKLHIDISDDSRITLYPGYAIEVTFTTFQEDNLITIPKTSLFRVNGQDAVWAAEDGRAVLRYVKKGISTDVDFVIEEGLKEGDLIIKNPNMDGLSEGKPVISPEERKQTGWLPF